VLPPCHTKHETRFHRSFFLNCYRAAPMLSVNCMWLLQPRILRFGFLQDGNVGIGVFPQCEKIFVRGERPHAGGIGIRFLRGSRLQSVRTSHSRMRQRSRPAVPLLFHPCQNLGLGSGIPASLLQKAEWVIVVPSTLRFALGVGGSIPICNPDSRTPILKTESH